jgi:ABC-type Mn2+/Zn2+ transport system ATPase subunit
VVAEADSFAGLPYRELSGGQRQRVLFARALASEADVVFLDEPTASVDAAGERAIYKQLDAMRRQRGRAVVVVTHAIASAATRADQVLFVDRYERGEGGSQRADEPADDADTSGEREVCVFASAVGVAVVGPPAAVFAHPRFQRHFGAVHTDVA